MLNRGRDFSELPILHINRQFSREHYSENNRNATLRAPAKIRPWEWLYNKSVGLLVRKIEKGISVITGDFR